MVSPASALCFVQELPLRLCGHCRSLELFGCSRRPRSPMPLPGANFKSSMTHIPQYLDGAKKRPLTVGDYHVLIEAGNLHDERVELINGLLFTMHPQSVEHRDVVWYLNDVFSQKLRDRAVVFPSMPVTLVKSNSEPEPDITIVSGSRINYMYRHPVADDTLLLVEVSNSTLRKDSGEKLKLYASENIPEYWVVDVERHSVRVLRNPEGKRYLHDVTFHTGNVAPAAYPDVLVNVEKLFPYKV